MEDRNRKASFFFGLLWFMIMEGIYHLFIVFTIFINARKIRVIAQLFLGSRTFCFGPFHLMIFEVRIFEGINRVKIDLYH